MKIYLEIKRGVRHPWQCRGSDDDTSQGTRRDAEDVVMIVAMTRTITTARPCHYHHGRRHLLSGSIGDAEDAARVIIMKAVSDAKNATISNHPCHLFHHLIMCHYHHGRRHLLCRNICAAEKAAMTVLITAVSDAKGATMIVIILLISYIII